MAFEQNVGHREQEKNVISQRLSTEVLVFNHATSLLLFWVALFCSEKLPKPSFLNISVLRKLVLKSELMK